MPRRHRQESCRIRETDRKRHLIIERVAIQLTQRPANLLIRCPSLIRPLRPCNIPADPVESLIHRGWSQPSRSTVIPHRPPIRQTVISVINTLFPSSKDHGEPARFAMTFAGGQQRFRIPVRPSPSRVTSCSTPYVPHHSKTSPGMTGNAPVNTPITALHIPTPSTAAEVRWRRRQILPSAWYGNRTTLHSGDPATTPVLYRTSRRYSRRDDVSQ